MADAVSLVVSVYVEQLNEGYVTKGRAALLYWKTLRQLTSVNRATLKAVERCHIHSMMAPLTATPKQAEKWQREAVTLIMATDKLRARPESWKRQYHDDLVIAWRTVRMMMRQMKTRAGDSSSTPSTSNMRTSYWHLLSHDDQ